MTTDELFEKFGGRDAVMNITGMGRNAVNNWRHDGVPFKHWPVLMQEAAKRGIPDVTFDTLRQTRPATAAEVA